MTPLILAKWDELVRDSQDRPDLLTLWASIRTDPDPENALVTVAAMYYQSLRSQYGTESQRLIDLAADEIAGLRGAIRILERLLAQALDR